LIPVSKSASTPRGVFTIGAALEERGWTVAGFVVQEAQGTGAVRNVYALSQSTDAGTAVMTCPTGITWDPCTQAVVVVGQGTYTDTASAVTTAQPCVARLPVDACEALTVQAGSGSATSEEERYYDVQADPCAPGCVLIVGSVHQGDYQVPSLRRVDVATLQPQVLPGVGATIATDTAFPEADAIAVSVGTSPALGCIVVGVQVTDAVQSSLWALGLSGSTLTNTSFNTVAGLLALPPSTEGVQVIKILVSASGATYAVCAAYADPAAASLPPKYVAVYGFTPDTGPNFHFGNGGISVFYGATYSSFRPTDAALTSDGQGVIVLGNMFAAEVAAGPDAATINTACLPWLTVYEEAGDSLAAPPVPFLVRFGCRTSPLMLGVPGCPCSAFTWASALVYTAATCQALIIGFCASKPLSPWQAVRLLTLQVSVSLSSARANNCQAITAEVITASCEGVVSVDALCAPTTLLVNGVVVVGTNDGADAPLPGAIRFIDGVFQGYTGTGWATFQMAT